MWLWYKPHGFCGSHPFQTYIYLNIQKPHIEHNYLPHANVFGNYCGILFNIVLKVTFLA